MGMREIKPVGFRPWPHLWPLIKQEAKEAGRSVNSQVNHYLAQGLRLDGHDLPKQKKRDV